MTTLSATSAAPTRARARIVLSWCFVDDPWTTAAFWSSVVITVVAIGSPRFAPGVDISQHAAIGAVLHRLMTSDAAAHATYRFHLFSYNALFDVLVALLAFFMRAETATRLLAAALPGLYAIAALAVAKAAGRPAWRALLVVPAAYGHAVAFGFMNYALGVPLGMLALASWLRARRGGDGRRRALVACTLLSLATSYAHPFAAACTFVAITVASFGSGSLATATLWSWLLARTRDLSPLAPAVAWTIAGRIAHLRFPDTSPMASANGYDVAAWIKIVRVHEQVLARVGGWWDDAAFLGALAIVVGLWIVPYFTKETEPRDRALSACAGVFVFAYLVVPTVWFASWAMFQRIAPWWIVFAALAAPRSTSPRLATTTAVRSIAAACALVAAATTWAHLRKIEGQDDADVILDQVPTGARLASVIYSWNASAVEQPIWIHVAAYALARKPIELGRSFLRGYGYLVVQEHEGITLPLRPSEWSPNDFDVMSPYGRHYTTVFVRTPDDAPDEDPTRRLFREHAPCVRLLAHRGRFWLFDTQLCAVP
jgi:hypothetical protein